MSNVVVLHPPPEPRDEACATGCSHPMAWLAGPCSQQCVKTSEFAEQSTRDAEASRLRFHTQQLKANVLRAVPPPPVDD